MNSTKNKDMLWEVGNEEFWVETDFVWLPSTGLRAHGGLMLLPCSEMLPDTANSSRPLVFLEVGVSPEVGGSPEVGVFCGSRHCPLPGPHL